MCRRLLVIALVTLLSPALALAAADVTQESCLLDVDSGLQRVHFSVTNQSLPGPVCGLFFVPEPLDDDCRIRDLSLPDGWMGATPFGAGDLWTEAIEGCIGPGETLTGFSASFARTGICCYVVEYRGVGGGDDVLLEEEVCFDCSVVDVEDRSWGAIKGVFRD